MQIDEGREAGVHVLSPAGRLDSTTAGSLEARLAAAIAQPQPILVIDFSAVDYISSAGLRILLLTARHVQERGGRLALCALGDSVRQVFYLAGFLSLFTIAPSREEALQRIAP